MTGVDERPGTDAFDAIEFLAVAQERGVRVARDGRHVRVDPGSASWRDWLTFATAAEDHEDEILEALEPRRN
jgi:DNA-binding transcriptional MocR family regulator